MSLVSQKVDNLLGGVSQLPHDLRAPNQLDILENAWASPKWGLRKRQPSSQVALISTSTAGYNVAFVHSVNRTPTERYTMVVANGDLAVFDSLTGVNLPVYFPDGKAYLVDAGRGFRATTVGDHTFLVNRNTTVARGTRFSAATPYEALLFIRQVDYDTSFSVAIEDEFVTVWTPSEAGPETKALVATDAVAKTLYDALTSNLTKIPTKFDFTLMGSTIHIKPKTPSNFIISVSDGLADKGLRLVKDSVQSLEDLPARAREGMVVEITGNPGAVEDNTWVKYESTSANEGIWRETTAPSVGLDINRATLPHEIIRQGYLTPISGHEDLPRQPAYKTTDGVTTTNGWTTDGFDVALSGAETDSKVVIGTGSVRTPALNGTHATLTRRVVVSYAIDTGDSPFAAGANVVLWYNIGAGWVNYLTKNYLGGAHLRNESFEFDMVLPVGTRFELQLTYPTVDPAGFTKPVTKNNRLVAFGSTAGTAAATHNPGVQVTTKPSLDISLGEYGDIWPMGTVIALTLNAVAFNYTLSSDMTTSQLHTALKILIDAHATFTATYTAPTGSPTLRALDSFQVFVTATGAAPTVTVATATFPAATAMWSSDLNMVVNEHVGRILQNQSDGSSGVITANSVRAFQVAAGMSGGTTNLFKTGDTCVVLGTGASYFVLRRMPMGDRLVGNEELSPWPSFVGRQINEVFFHANRLGFTAEDYVQMSGAGDLYRFFRKTTTQVLDDDPIDIQSAHSAVAMLDAAVQWDGQLVLCSSSGHQFTLTGDPVVSPGTVRLDHMSSFPSTDRTRPLSLGVTLVLPSVSGAYANIREVFKTRDGLQSDLLTEHVPTYLPGDVTSMCGDADLGFLAVLTNGSPRSNIYIYNFAKLSADTNMKCWGKWTFSDRVMAINFAAGYLYLVLWRAPGYVWLERIDLAGTPSLGTDHRDDSTYPYTFKARFSRFHLRDQNGIARNKGRTQIRTLQLNHHDNEFYKVTVDSTGKTQKVYYVESSILYSPAATRPGTTIGKTRLPVLSDTYTTTIEILNDTPKGCAFSSVEWEATYGERSQAG